MFAKDVMVTRLYTIEASATIWAALSLMELHDIRHLVVMDGGAFTGVLSNRDYRRVLDRRDAEGTIHGVNDVAVREIMTAAESVITAHPERRRS